MELAMSGDGAMPRFGASEAVHARRLASLVSLVLLGALLTFAVLAERRGDEPYPAVDLASGATLLVAGVVTVHRRGHRFPGSLLLVAGASWFVATADLAGAVSDRVTWVHRALLVHAVLITYRPAALVRGAVIVLAYIGSIERDRALSTTWLGAIAAATALTLLVDTVRGRVTWRFSVPASAGVLTWTAAVGLMLEHDVLGKRGRLAVYGAGLGVMAITVAVWVVGRLRASDTPTSADIVRDGGRADVRIGFCPAGSAGFEDIEGRPFAPDSTEATARIELGGDLGTAVIAIATQALDVSRVERELVDGLRLLAANHLALQATRLQAAEVAASEQRIREADSLAAAQIGLELDRFVVQRIDEALELIGQRPTGVGDDVGRTLLHVRAEVQALAAGLSPMALDGGLPSALAALAREQPVPVQTRLVDLRVDPSVARALYFAAAECLTNAVRHAHASTVELALTMRDAQAELTVTDNGRGGARINPGGGLDGLLTRVAVLGGELTVRDRGEGGTVITARLPLVVSRS